MRPRSRAAAAVATSVALIAVLAHGASASPRFPVDAPVNYGEGLGAGRGHEGQDLFAPAGTPLVAVEDSVVVGAGSDGGRGNWVALFSPSTGRTYVYLHMAGPAAVLRGQAVPAGTRVGRLGCTGACWGPHLHFEVRRGRGPYAPVVDPLAELRRLEAAERDARWRWLAAGAAT